MKVIPLGPQTFVRALKNWRAWTQKALWNLYLFETLPRGLQTFSPENQWRNGGVVVRENRVPPTRLLTGKILLTYIVPGKMRQGKMGKWSRREGKSKGEVENWIWKEEMLQNVYKYDLKVESRLASVGCIPQLRPSNYYHYFFFFFFFLLFTFM